MNDTPVVIFCGGKGNVLDDSGKRRCKALIEVAGRPMVQHVMDLYRRAGFSRFVLCGGYQLDELQQATRGPGVECVDTGLDTRTGGRLRRVRDRVQDAAQICVTYSDTLASVDLQDELRFHKAHGKLATLLAARIPTRFRILGIRPGEQLVRGFASKPVIRNDAINGGFYVFDQRFFTGTYLDGDDALILEDAVLERLAAEAQLMAYPFEGEWQHIDAERDLAAVARIVTRAAARR